MVFLAPVESPAVPGQVAARSLRSVHPARRSPAQSPRRRMRRSPVLSHTACIPSDASMASCSARPRPCL